MVENRRRIGLAGVIISLLLVAALMGGCAANAASAAPPPAARTTLTAEQLEAQYGLRVNLLALTAAGGMVDLRLTVTDAAKAAALLGNLSPALGLAGPQWCCARRTMVCRRRSRRTGSSFSACSPTAGTPLSAARKWP